MLAGVVHVMQTHPCTRDLDLHRRGEISDIVVMETRGFGFVTFADPASAQSFLANKEHVIGAWRSSGTAPMHA